jgi:hypothetical protein
MYWRGWAGRGALGCGRRCRVGCDMNGETGPGLFGLARPSCRVGARCARARFAAARPSRCGRVSCGAPRSGQSRRVALRHGCLGSAGSALIRPGAVGLGRHDRSGRGVPRLARCDTAVSGGLALIWSDGYDVLGPSSTGWSGRVTISLGGASHGVVWPGRQGWVG